MQDFPTNTTQITGSATLSSGPGYVGRLAITSVGSGATIIVYDDNDAGTTKPLWSWATAEGKINQLLDCRFTTGLRVVFTGTGAVGWISWE